MATTERTASEVLNRIPETYNPPPLTTPEESVRGTQIDNIPTADDVKASRKSIKSTKTFASSQKGKKRIRKAWQAFRSIFRPWEKKPLTFAHTQDGPGLFEQCGHFFGCSVFQSPEGSHPHSTFYVLLLTTNNDFQALMEKMKDYPDLVNLFSTSSLKFDKALETFATKSPESISVDEAKAWFQTVNHILKVGKQKVEDAYTCIKVQFWFLDLWTKFTNVGEEHGLELAALSLAYHNLLKNWAMLMRDDKNVLQAAAWTAWGSELLYYDRAINFKDEDLFDQFARHLKNDDQLVAICKGLTANLQNSLLKEKIQELGNMAKKTNVANSAQQKSGIVRLLIQMGYGPDDERWNFRKLAKDTKELARQVLRDLAGVNKGEPEVFDHSAQRILHEQQVFEKSEQLASPASQGSGLVEQVLLGTAMQAS